MTKYFTTYVHHQEIIISRKRNCGIDVKKIVIHFPITKYNKLVLGNIFVFQIYKKMKLTFENCVGQIVLYFTP